MMICKKCGTENSDNASVCAKCGNTLKVVSKPKSNLFDFSLCSGLMLIFCALALIFLIIPSTRTVSFTESEGKMPVITEVEGVEVMKTIRDKMSISNEVAKIDGNLAKYDELTNRKAELEKQIEEAEGDTKALDDELKAVEDEITKVVKNGVWHQDWTADEAIKKIQELDPSDSNGYVEGIKALNDAYLNASDTTKGKAREELDAYIEKAIDAQDEDRVDKGAIGGAIREHRVMKDITNTILAVMCVLLAASLFITMVSWVTRMYRVRIIAAIANAVLALFTFVIPLAVWTFETKWPFEVSKYMTYGISFGATFVFVLMFSFATLFTALAYFADDLFGKKN